LDENWYTDYEKHAEFKGHKGGSLRLETAKIKCKKRYRIKKATLYEREVIKKQKFFSLAEGCILIQQVVRQS
jgi:hypothetical protein